MLLGCIGKDLKHHEPHLHRTTYPDPDCSPVNAINPDLDHLLYMDHDRDWSLGPV